MFERVGSDVVPSLVRLGLGYAIACFVAIALGLALGLSRPLRRALDPVVQFLRSIPPPALLPFGILVLGVGNSMKVFIIAFVCVWPVLLNTIDGVAGVDPTLRETARVYGIGARDRVLRVMLPAAAPQIFAGMRTSLSLALILMVISEMVASTNGIGYFVLQSQRSFAIPEMWSGILLLGHPRVRAQRRLRARRAARPAMAPRRARQRPELRATDAARRAPEEELRRRSRRSATCRSRSPRGEFVCIVGPSGCGKTTLLKCASRPARARPAARCGSRARPSTGPPEKMALVFQEYSRSLFPWMTVRQNVAFPLRRRKRGDARPRLVERALDSVGLDRLRSTATRGSSRAGCSSASRSRARSPTSRASC